MQVDARARNGALLDRMIARECEVLRFTKEQYDQDFPEHSMELSRSEIRLIAQRSVMERLSVPDSVTFEQIHDVHPR